MSKTIFITGASKGFGRLWTEALLKKGDKVAATARNISALNDLKAEYGDQVLILPLDVNKREEVFGTVKTIEDHFGQIDVLINNAGYGLFGTIEETSEQQAREQIETNLFGSLWVTQAVLPGMRKHKSGHIIQISSFLGLTTLPLLGLYNASKFAVEGLIETLGTEVAHLGIKTTLIEPNGYATDWSGASAVQTTDSISDYNAVRESFAKTGASAEIWGNPEATVEPILNIIDSNNPPSRLLLGKIAYHAIHEFYHTRLKEVDDWKEVSIKAHGF
nr:SDR family NAD(P)-dependent oxidoreductase [uncultured Chryseobacterium sp.]